MSWTIATVTDLDHESPDLAAAVRDSPGGIDLIVLPFLGAAPYLPASLDRSGLHHAERPPYRTVQRVAAAAKTRGISVVMPFYEVVGEGVRYSTAVLIASDGAVEQTYRQAHAVNRPGQHEQLFFQPGTLGFPVATMGEHRLGMLLGGDLWVPEAARLLALGGANLLLAIGAASAVDRELTAVLARARAAENGRPLLLALRGHSDIQGLTLFFGADGVERPTEAGTGYAIATLDQDDLRPANPATDPLRLRRPRLYESLAHGDENAPASMPTTGDGAR